MNFEHKVDKTIIPTVSILGVRIADIDMEWLLNFSKEYLHQLAGDYICVSNVHTTVMSYEDESFKRIQNNGILAIPDGGPLSVVGRWRGAKKMSRTTGPDYMNEILSVSSLHGWRHYFYGSTPDTLNKLKDKINSLYPDVMIAGMYSPPFRPLSEFEDLEVVEQINSSNADFVWVGLGAPKQEKWMFEHQGIVDGLMVGVGAAFDYMAGNIKRAPKWMQNNNMEWVYRLIQDPKRLFNRYLVTNTKFLWNAIVRCK